MDNASAGGFFCGIDLATGTICTNGYDYMGNEYIRHPDNSIALEGTQIPYWEEVVALAHRLMGVIPEMKCIAWDIAITTRGVCVIEGNNSGDLDMVQIAFGPKKKEILSIIKNIEQ